MVELPTVFLPVFVNSGVTEISRLSRITFQPNGKPTVPLKELIIIPIGVGILGLRESNGIGEEVLSITGVQAVKVITM